MRTLRTSAGPFASRPYYKPAEIETICEDELRRVGLYPEKPEPVRIDRFIEKRFGFSHDYEDLPEGVLGFSIFGSNGVERIVVARSLDDEGTPAADRRIRSTLAHEAGHALLQGHLFALGDEIQALFGDASVDGPKMMCRDVSGVGANLRKYDGRWWEFQANSAIGALLLPRRLVISSVESLLTAAGSLGIKGLATNKREEAARQIAQVFDVNPIVARIRIDEVFGKADERQLSL